MSEAVRASKADENYRRMRAELDEILKGDKQLAAIAEKIKAGKATFADTAKYSEIVAKHLSGVIQGNIGTINSPLGLEYVCKALLADHYDAINDVLGDVQAVLDEKNGIHIRPQKAPYPAERVQQVAHSLVDPTVTAATIARRAAAPVENVAKSMHDDYMQENAEFRSKAGLKCWIVRQTDGKCCPWCSSIAGRYVYGEEPQEVYRRHDNCGCTVTYENGRQRQDVWSKRSWEVPEITETARPTIFSLEEGRRLEQNALNRLTLGGGRGIMGVVRKVSAQQFPPDFSQYAISDDPEAVAKVKQMLMQAFGLSEGDIDLQGIRNAEALEPFAAQLIRIQQETGMRMPRIIATDVIDGDACCIAGYKPMENRFYISSRYFNSKEALLDTLKTWSSQGILPKQAKSLRYLAEHETAHMRIPEELLMSEDAVKIWKKRNLQNNNDSYIYEYYADAVALFRMNPNSSDKNLINAINFLQEGGAIV